MCVYVCVRVCKKRRNHLDYKNPEYSIGRKKEEEEKKEKTAPSQSNTPHVM
jgi:hypothetical protein